MRQAAKPWRRTNFTCLQCGGPARTRKKLPGGRRVRLCLACGFWFVTALDGGGIEVFECKWLPDLPAAKPTREKPRGPDGYGPPQERTFELAYHHYLVDYREFGSLDPRYEQAEGHLRLLRGPAIRPVARDHGDLRRGELSLVLE